jgi:hypothetical protein
MKHPLVPDVLVVLVVSLAANANAQQPDFPKVEVRPTPVAGDVYMLQGEGGNIGVSAGPDGLLVQALPGRSARACSGNAINVAGVRGDGGAAGRRRLG